jgi:general transcription factor IIIA
MSDKEKAASSSASTMSERTIEEEQEEEEEEEEEQEEEEEEEDDNVLITDGDAKKIFLCDTCGKTYNKGSKLKIHLRTHTGERPFVCDVSGCLKTFMRKSTLDTHYLVHNPSKEFVCTREACGLTFRDKDHLHRHDLAVHDESKFKHRCKFCDEVFRTVLILRDHYREIHQFCEFACDKCQAEFPSQSKLATHMLTHSLKSPDFQFICCMPGCVSFFKTEGELDDHTKSVHGSALLSESSVIEAAVNIDSAVKRGVVEVQEDLLVIISSDPVSDSAICKPVSAAAAPERFSCKEEGCDRHYKELRSLRAHVIAHHSGERRYICSHCDRRFGYKGDHSRHLKNVHNGGRKPDDEPIKIDTSAEAIEAGLCSYKSLLFYVF